MGSRLRKLKQKMGRAKLADGKTLEGRGRLTHAAINEIQNYYDLAIRLDAMKTAVWAEYFHLGSSNERPAHSMCPKGAYSWCKNQRAQASKESYDQLPTTQRLLCFKSSPILETWQTLIFSVDVCMAERKTRTNP